MTIVQRPMYQLICDVRRSIPDCSRRIAHPSKDDLMSNALALGWEFDAEGWATCPACLTHAETCAGHREVAIHCSCARTYDRMKVFAGWEKDPRCPIHGGEPCSYGDGSRELDVRNGFGPTVLIGIKGQPSDVQTITTRGYWWDRRRKQP